MSFKCQLNHLLYVSRRLFARRDVNASKSKSIVSFIYVDLSATNSVTAGLLRNSPQVGDIDGHDDRFIFPSFY